MSKQILSNRFSFISQWLILFFMLMLLTACGGGSEGSGSNLLVGAGKNNATTTTGGSTGGSTTTTTPQTTDISVMGGAQELIPSGGRTTISFVTYQKFDATQPNPQMITVPGVTFKVSVTGSAVLENVPQQSNKEGEVIFTVSHPGNENVLVTIQGTGQYVGGFIIPLYFGASVTAKVITEGNVPADGKTPANIAVFARDWAGIGISGVSVDLSFSGNSFAVPTQAVSGTGTTTTTQTSSSKTGADGQFTIGITDTVAQTIKVTPFAGGMPAAPLTLTFEGTVVAVKPASLHLLIKTDNVLADGKAQVILVVVARDPAGTPVPNVPISLTSDSATALLKIGDTTGTLFIKGNTGPLGSFELVITDTVEESINITASTTSGDATTTKLEKSVKVQFTNQVLSSGAVVDHIDLDPVINNKQPANGKDMVTVRGRVLDKDNNPIANQRISVIVNGGSAKFSSPEPTDPSGRFFATFTDEVVEEFTVKAVVGEVSSNPVSVSFIATGEAASIPPQSITLLASPSKQMVDDGTRTNAISLTASTRDSNGTPMEGVKVRVAATSNSAVFDVGTQKTSAGGTATFKVSNTIAGSFTVTATAWVEDSKGQVVGTPISSSQTVSFYETATTVIEVSQLTVRALNDKQPASTTGDKPIKLEVVALDSLGRAVKDAPIIIQMASSVAIASPPNGKTDDKGYFSTDITSIEAGVVPVTVAVEGTKKTADLMITFIAVEVTGGEVKPESVKLEIFNDSQPADGASKVTLIVTPLAKGTPLAGVDITLISNSDTAKLASDSGKTNALGEFRTTVTDTVAETITVTAVAATNNTAKDTKPITFIPAGSSVTDLLVNIVNNNAPATGQDADAVELDIIARDAKGRPVAGTPISVQLNKGSPAVVHSDKQVTDNNGLFITKITSTVAGDTTVTVTIEGTKVTHPPVVINFKPPAVPVTPTTIEARLLPTNATQPADGKTEIILVVIPRDAQQAIVPGVSVELISDSRTAVINTSPTVTNALGEARFAVTDTVVETFNVTPVAAGVVGAKLTLNFTTIPLINSNVKDLVATVVKNNQAATGEDKDAAVVSVVARDAQGQALADVPITVQLPAGSVAIAKFNTDVTDKSGLFVANIVSTVVGDVDVTVGVKGTELKKTVKVTFKPALSATPTTIEARPLTGAQPADGKTEIILVFIPRDAQQAIIPGVSVELISDSRTAVINTSPTTTNALGEARFAVTDTVVETFKVTPVAAGVVGTPLMLTFITIPPLVSNVKDLVATVVKNNQAATGEDKDAAVVSVVARDAQGQALADVPITVQLPVGSVAIAKFDKDVTDKSGLFVANIVSTVVGDIDVTVGVKGTELKKTVKVTFKSPVTPNTVPTSVETKVSNNASQIADGQSAISVIVIPKDAQSIPMPGVKVEFISDSTTAKIDPASATTNALGEARFTVTSTTPQTVTLTPVVGGVVVDKTKPPLVLTFLPLDNSKGKTLIPNVVNNNQPATGKAENAIQVDVVVRDQTGKTLPDIPLVVLQLPAGTIAMPIEGITAKENGVFSTKITSTKAGDINFQVGIKDTNYSVPVTVNFVAEKQIISPTTVEIAEVRPQSASQPADGTSTITLIVIPRSQDGTPIPDVTIELVSDPNQLKIDSGKTNALGQYQATVKSDVVGTFTITPIASKDTTTTAAKITGKPISITFTALGLQVADLTVTVVNDKQPATGKDEIQIDVVARDNGGRPVADAPIVVQLPTSSAAVAKSAIDPPKTDKNGYFSTKITSTIAGDVAVTISIKDTNIARPPVIVTFTPPAGGVTPTTVELLVLNAPQAADGKATITLEVTPRDAKGQPMANVDVALIHDSNTAKLEKESGTSNAVGVFRTTITDAVAETVNVTPVAAKGAVIGQKVPVTFIPVAIPIPATITLTVDYASGDTGQQVGQSATLTVFAYDDKHGPLNAVPITLVTMPGDDPPDVSSTAKFDEATGAQGKTGKADGSGNGTFITKISNSQSGTFKVVAKVTGTSLSSNTVKVSFSAGASTAPEVSDISLISDYPQLGTDNKNDKTEGVTITAILKDKDNNLVKGAIVRFSADSGEIRAISIKDSTALPGVTDDSGRAQALLTTSANRNNRVITVTAQVSTAKGEVKTATIPIKVVGTNIKVTGENTLIMGGKSEITITLADNGKNGIPNETLKVESSLGNTLSNPAPVTDANGQTKVTVTATVPGQDVITVSKDGATSGTLTINISDQDFTLVSIPATADLQKIPLNTPQEFLVRWKKGGVPQALQQINLSATRGKLPASVTTDINGEAHFTITADNAGPTQIKATAAVSGGPSQQINANFIATKVTKMTLQADPSTIGVNASGAGPEAKLEQSTITAVLRDEANNLVEGKTVNFTLTDNTGGNLSPTASVTDQFGQASTKYTAGTSSSASNGVAVVATVEGRPTIDCAGGETNNTKDGCIVKLTVALQRAFISLGSGNQIIIRDESTYQYPYKVLATDINGAPIPNTEIIISVWPLGYLKGVYQAQQADKNGQGGGWNIIVTAPPDLSKNPPYCINEDVNQNGVLDPGEDRNHNSRLDPGGIATFAPGEKSVVTGNTMKVKTGNDGYADIGILYTKDMSNWVIVELTARTSVSGSEDRASVTITLTGAVTDFGDPKKTPPGRTFPDGHVGSPFGLGGPLVVDSTKTPPTVSAPNATCDNDL